MILFDGDMSTRPVISSTPIWIDIGRIVMLQFGYNMLKF